MRDAEPLAHAERVVAHPLARGRAIQPDDAEQLVGAPLGHAELHMTVATVKAHVSRLLTKLEADKRVQVALLVQDAGP